jgi:hypothetical protein
MAAMPIVNNTEIIALKIFDAMGIGKNTAPFLMGQCGSEHLASKSAIIYV